MIPARIPSVEVMGLIMKTWIILHNMNVEERIEAKTNEPETAADYDGDEAMMLSLRRLIWRE